MKYYKIYLVYNAIAPNYRSHIHLLNVLNFIITFGNDQTNKFV